jgi:hypothetical protein
MTQVATLVCLVILTDYTEKKLEITYGYFPLGGVVNLAISVCIVYVNIGYFNFDKVKFSDIWLLNLVTLLITS